MTTYKLIFSVPIYEDGTNNVKDSFEEITMVSPFIPKVGDEITLDGPLNDEQKVERVIHYFNKESGKYEYSYVFLEA
jgi:hypothetical protein